MRGFPKNALMTRGVSGSYTFYNDGTVGNVTAMTVSGGVITSITEAT